MKPADRSREKIITSALALFASKGYVATSVDSIAARAKISKGLIYYHFGSKEGILKGIFLSITANAGDLFEIKEPYDPRRYLEKIVSDSFGFILQQTKLFRLLLALTAQPEVVKGLRDELETFREKFITELVITFKALAYPHPELEAYLLYAIFDGIGLAYLAMRDYPVMEMKMLIEQKYGLSPGGLSGRLKMG